MKQITFLLAMLLASYGFSQNLPLDFEDGTTVPAFQFNGSPFQNVANPETNNNPSTRVLRVDKSTTSQGGNAADWFAGFGFQGTSVVDLANGTTLTMKIWSSQANAPVRVRLQGGTSPAYNFDFTTGATSGVWEDITMDFAAANPGITGTEVYPELVIQPNFDFACEGANPPCTVVTVDGIYYFDDINQPNSTPPSADATLSDLTVDSALIAGFSPNVTTYDVEVPSGTTTAPTVDGTATQAGSGSSSVNIAQANGIPGQATLVVTAPDGVAMRTYTVNFAEEVVSPTGIAPQRLSDGTNLIVYSDVAPGAGDSTVSNFVLDLFGNATRGPVDLDNDMTNETFRLQDVGFYGAEWTAEDLTALPYNFVHVHYFSESVNEFRFFLIDQSAGIPGGNPEEPRFTVSNSGAGDATLVQGSWQSVFMPLSVFENYPTPNFNYDLTDIFQYKFETGLPGVFGNGVMFFDNVFFSTTQTLSTSSFSVESLLITPNPTQDIWNFNDPINTIKQISLYDMTGKLVMDNTPNSHKARLDGSALGSGIYIASVSTEAGTQTVKLVKK